MCKNDNPNQQGGGPAAPLAIVTVTYSPGRHLGAFLESLPQATHRNVVTIMADNGSTDGVPEAAARDNSTVVFLPTGGNIGYGGAINAAANYLRPQREAGEIDSNFFLISNPDVEFLPGSIDRLLDCIESEPRAGAVGPRIEEADGSAYPSARAVPNVVTGIGHALLSGVWPGNPFTKAYKDDADMDNKRVAGWLSGACLLVRWEAFEEVGGFDERYFMYMEDVDFGDRLTRAGWQSIFCPEARIMHDQGHSANKHSRVTVPAHHDSAYRFQADRHPYMWQAPLRAVLWLGLKARGYAQTLWASRTARRKA
ncbi:glycosyltransferase family 2 protein [Corynebacterium breve]|uniref:Glycosyltransferase family 2 protein n=1 Tax=Corynebacterium breve TaxID=3049799 RepID=A0ABY8VH30_9CORY|nr:glycosyltransferase family 2 protein [Corynebacterium breve]WIM68256.1 glycosyltransferase family 2 protein [Corynebacterium breve]